MSTSFYGSTGDPRAESEYDAGGYKWYVNSGINERHVVKLLRYKSGIKLKHKPRDSRLFPIQSMEDQETRARISVREFAKMHEIEVWKVYNLLGVKDFVKRVHIEWSEQEGDYFLKPSYIYEETSTYHVSKNKVRSYA